VRRRKALKEGAHRAGGKDGRTRWRCCLARRAARNSAAAAAFFYRCCAATAAAATLPSTGATPPSSGCYCRAGGRFCWFNAVLLRVLPIHRMASGGCRSRNAAADGCCRLFAAPHIKQSWTAKGVWTAAGLLRSSPPYLRHAAVYHCSRLTAGRKRVRRGIATAACAAAWRPLPAPGRGLLADFGFLCIAFICAAVRRFLRCLSGKTRAAAQRAKGALLAPLFLRK